MTVTGHGDDGRVIASATVAFPAEALEGEGRLELPAELRNRIGQLRIEGEHGAGAVTLLDERWRRRPGGVITDSAAAREHSLCSASSYYLNRALEPFTELRQGPMEELFARDLAVAILPDSCRRAWMPRGSAELEEWVEQRRPAAALSPARAWPKAQRGRCRSPCVAATAFLAAA